MGIRRISRMVMERIIARFGYELKVVGSPHLDTPAFSVAWWKPECARKPCLI